MLKGSKLGQQLRFISILSSGNFSIRALKINSKYGKKYLKSMMQVPITVVATKVAMGLAIPRQLIHNRIATVLLKDYDLLYEVLDADI